MEDGREANIKVVDYKRTSVLGELKERAVSIDYVREAVNKMKSG